MGSIQMSAQATTQPQRPLEFSDNLTNKKPVRDSSHIARKHKIIGLAAMTLLGLVAYKAFSSPSSQKFQGTHTNGRQQKEIRKAFSSSFSQKFQKIPTHRTQNKEIETDRNLFPPAQESTQSYIRNLFSTGCWESFQNFKGEVIPCFDKARQINFNHLRELSPSQQQHLIKTFNLESYIEDIEKSFTPPKNDFFQQLAEADPEILAMVKLSDLVNRFQRFKYVFMKDQDFQQIVIGEKVIEDGTRDIILKRLNNSSKNSIPDCDLPADTTQLTLIQFSALTSEQITKLASTLPANIFFLVSDAQFEKLNLVYLSKEQLESLFHFEPNRISSLPLQRLGSILHKLSNYDLANHITDEQLKGLTWSQLQPLQIENLLYKSEKVKVLSSAQLNSIINHLSEGHLKSITNVQLQALEWEKLNQQQIAKLLYNSDKVALLSPAQLNSIINHVPELRLKSITNAQFQALDWAKLNQQQIANLLHNSDKVALLSSAQLNSILNHVPARYLRSSITDAQFQALEWEKLNQEQVTNLLSDSDKVALLSPTQLNSILNHVPERHLQFSITEAQFKALEWEKLNQRQIENLLFQNNRVALLSPSQLNSILNHVSEQHLKFSITDEQLRALDWANLTQNQIQNLLHRGGKVALLSPDQLQSIINHMPVRQFRSITDDQIKKLDLTKIETDQQLWSLLNRRERIALLSSDQLNSIFNRLTELMRSWITTEQSKQLIN